MADQLGVPERQAWDIIDEQVAAIGGAEWAAAKRQRDKTGAERTAAILENRTAPFRPAAQ